jgi:hypothetical protein
MIRDPKIDRARFGDLFNPKSDVLRGEKIARGMQWNADRRRAKLIRDSRGEFGWPMYEPRPVLTPSILRKQLAPIVSV